ncbi:MAG: hypothetical protein GY816_10640 [Cytophagales bacterium]|nr:hypothetical protein [Cytophagales bacterium]
MRKFNILVLLIFFQLIAIKSYGQQEISLSDQLSDKKMKAVSRTISLYGDQQDAVEMNAEKSDGLGILGDVEFDKGSIEVELLGENNPGRSFIGIAFNIQNDSTYEVVYFRPFNFVAEEQIRKEHMVQYIFHPEYTWRKLREERTGEFESKIPIPPNPDDWFKAKINISTEKAEVYVVGISKPVLVIDRLTTSKSNEIGIWTGYGSSGRFKNLVLRDE